jgi:Helicase conserved C-terminal domain
MCARCVRTGSHPSSRASATRFPARTVSARAQKRCRPLWVTPEGRMFLETFSPVYKQAYDFLIAIAEPVSRPEVVHEYTLTVHSLYAAVSVGLPPESIIAVLNRLSKNFLDDRLTDIIRSSTENYGKARALGIVFEIGCSSRARASRHSHAWAHALAASATIEKAQRRKGAALEMASIAKPG